MDDVKEIEEQRAKSAEAAMAAQGASTSIPAQEDYFAFEQILTINLPDGVSWIQHKVLTEGDRRNYRNKTNRSMRVKRGSGDAEMDVRAGDDLHTLLELSIVNWNLVRGGKPLPFGKGSKGAPLNQFLEAANPKLIDLIETEVRKANPWLLAEMSLEDIDKEIERLEEMRDVKLKEEEGKATLSA